jgi:two-component system nitrate/nitrite response regulator NarL
VVCPVRLYREGLQLDLADSAGLDVAGTAADAASATALVSSAEPVVAVVDVSLLLSSNLAAELRRTSPGTRIVALGVRDDAPQIVACAELGVAGYVLRDATVEELVQVLWDTARGEARCAPAVAACLMSRVAELASAVRTTGVPDPLTAREHEVMALIDQGLMNKEIARRLGLSLSTVKNHVHNVLDKLALRSRTDIARWHRATTRDRAD